VSGGPLACAAEHAGHVSIAAGAPAGGRPTTPAQPQPPSPPPRKLADGGPIVRSRLTNLYGVRRWLVPSIAVAVGAALIALLVFGLTKQGSSRALDAAIAAGRTPPAPDAARALPVLDGVGAGNASLARWRGNVVVVNFWASWCTTCIAEASLIERAERSLAASGGGAVVGIDYKDVGSQAMRYVHRHGLTYANLRDVDGSFASAYGTAALPETFVLDRHLRVVAIARGQLTSENTLAGWIRRAERA